MPISKSAVSRTAVLTPCRLKEILSELNLLGVGEIVKEYQRTHRPKVTQGASTPVFAVGSEVGVDPTEDFINQRVLSISASLQGGGSW